MINSLLKRKLKTTSIAYLFLAPAILIMAIFVMYPVLQGFWLSFYQCDPYSSEATFIGWDNYRQLIADPQFRITLCNSILYLIVVPIIIILSLGMAVLVEPLLPGVNFFRAAWYIPVVTTMVVVGVSFRFIFSEDDGLINEVLKYMGIIQQSIPWMTEKWLVLITVMVVTIWKGLGYYMVAFIAALRAVPIEQIEAAIVDGAKPWSIFRNVKLPNLWPTITLVAILSSIGALQAFDEIYVLTRGAVPEATTLVYYIYEMGFDASQSSYEYGYASAMAVVLFFIVLAFTALNLWTMRKGGWSND